ncbi:hypothetical protein GT030_03500, partial [Streptomyces sp. SID1328]|nr:hypothetical protein [Streptomyces sp. SID1328]
MLVVDADGTLIETNKAARRLIPLVPGDSVTSAAMPAWLAAADRALRLAGT